VRQWEKIDTADMISFGTIETRREGWGRSNFESERIHGHAKAGAIVYKRKIRVESKIPNEMFHGSKMDWSSVHLILS
jgi:hypothetical protein